MSHREFVPAVPKGKTKAPDSPVGVSPETDEAEDAVATCTFEGSTYNKGDQICINKTVHQCGSHGWFVINKSC